MIPCTFSMLDELSSELVVRADDVVNLLGVATGIGIAIAFVFVFLATILHHIFNTSRWEKVWGWISSHLSLLFVIALFMGFAVYSVGMMTLDDIDCISWSDKWVKNMLGISFMAIIDSFEMFLLQSDVSAIHSPFHNNFLFMTCFSAAHSLAAFVSLAFVIKHFGFGLVSKWRLWIVSRCGGRRDELFIFWGMNETSFLLAKDITQHLTDKTKRILFVNNILDAEKSGTLSGIDCVLNFLSVKDVEIERLKSIDCYLTNTHRRLSALNVNESRSVIGTLMGLTSVKRLMSKTIGDVHIFFSSDNCEANLKAVANIRCDNTLTQVASAGHQVRIYCNAHNSSVTRAFEDKYSQENVDVKIIDSAHLCINMLKQEPKYHPINFVDVDTQDNLGTVKSKFNCMIIGFGDTGQEALRFLYEYAAFVDSSSDKEDDLCGKLADGRDAHVRRSPMECDIVDQRISDVSGRFFANAPALKKALTNDDAKQNVRLHLHECNTQSAQFYDLIQTRARDWNYIVVATGDDEANISIAASLYSKIRQYRQNLNKFKIFVRCHSEEHATFMNIIKDHYNQRDSQQCFEAIVVFGMNAHIYTYNNIIANSFEQLGKEYNYAYCNITHSSDDSRWENRHKKLIGKRTLDAYSQLRRKESQDLANAYHLQTKIQIFHAAYPCKRSFDEFVQLICGAHGEDCNFRREEPRHEEMCVERPNVGVPIRAMLKDSTNALTAEEDLLMLNLARLEHLRWNASHEALGYVSVEDYVSQCGEDFDVAVKHSCNETHRWHNCILPWEQLDNESLEAWENVKLLPEGYRYSTDYKLFDYGVVATSLYRYRQTVINN